MLLTLDFETYYGTGYSLSLQAINLFKYVADPQFMIHGVGVKLDDRPTTYFDFHNPGDDDRFRDLLRSLETEEVTLLCHNTAFDGFILHYHYGWHPAYYLDTLSMGRGLFIGMSNNLADLAIRLFPNAAHLRKMTNLEEDTKNKRELTPGERERLGNYCIRDVDLCHAAFNAMHPHYPDAELDLIDWTLRALCEPVIHADLDLIQTEIDEQVDMRKRLINASGVPEGVLKSDKQYVQLLRNLGMDIPLKRNAKDTADIPAMGQKDWGYLKLQAAHPDKAAIFEARKVAKSNIQESRARWFKAVAEWNDGLLPIALKYYGADTGRWSGGEKLNQQNLPRINGNDPSSGRLRKAMVAPHGYVIIVRDLNNIEGRKLAWLAQEEYLLDLFRNDGCPYLYMAENIYGVPHGTFDKNKNKGERSTGKIAVLGLGYGMSANKFWITVNTGPMGMPPIPMTFEECQNIVNIYRTTNSNIVRYWRGCDNAIQWMASLDPGKTYQFGPLELHRDMAVMPNGMALQYPGLHGEPNQFGGYDFTFGKGKKLYGAHATENFCQALSRVLISEQLLTIQKELDSNYGRDFARVVHMVHDELLVVAPERYADEIFDMMGDVMSTPPSWAPDLPLKSEGGYAYEYSK